MSYLKTKPNYTECFATESGWVDSTTGELLVAIKNLKSLIDDEEKSVNVDVYEVKKTKTTKKDKAVQK